MNFQTCKNPPHAVLMQLKKLPSVGLAPPIKPPGPNDHVRISSDI